MSLTKWQEEHLKAVRQAKGADLTEEEFMEALDLIPAEPSNIAKAIAPVERVVAKLPGTQILGYAKQLTDKGINAFSEKFPTAAQAVGVGLTALNPLPLLAKYGADEGLRKLGVEPDDLKLSAVAPETSKTLHADPRLTDMIPLLMMSRGSIKPSAGEGMLRKGARRAYNIGVDPLGSALKYPEWQKQQDFNTAKGKQEQFKKDLDAKLEQERPAPLSEEEKVIADMLQQNNLLPIQSEASRRIQNVQQSLADEGVTSGKLASDIVSSQKYGISDADVLYLAQHPEFMGNPEIQRMAQNIAERERPQPKISLPPEGMRQNSPRAELKGQQNPPSEQLTLPLMESDAAKVGVLPPEYSGMYSVQHAVPQKLRQVTEQPPLRGLEDVAGTSGPVASTADGVLFHPDLKVAEGAEAPVLGKSTFTNEGVAVPKYELNPQENFDLSKYPDQIPDDVYTLRQQMDDAAKWVYNKQGVNKEAGNDKTLGAIASKVRAKYQKSSEPLPAKYRSEHLKRLVESENAMRAEANKLAPPESQQPLVEFPKTIGEATSLLNKDTVRTLEQQQKLSPIVKGEGELSLMDQMGGSGDPRAFAEELRISRQFPELEEFSTRIRKAKDYNKEIAAFETKRDRLQKEAASLPYSRANINLADPKFLEEMISSLALWGPEATMHKYGALAGGRMAGNVLNKVSDSSAGKFLKETPKLPGPYRSIKNEENEYEFK